MQDFMEEYNPVLMNHNKHKRDSYIEFEERGHKYTITVDPNSKYTSVTTWNHSHFPKFDADKIIKSMMSGPNWKEGHKYWGMTAEQIKSQWTNNGAAVSGAGTDMHYNIECFMNCPLLSKGYTQGDILKCSKGNFKVGPNESIEWKYFLKFVADYPNLKPYRTEWMIYDETLKLAGSIDMVYENEDGTLSIFDWKRSKSITKTSDYNKFAVTQCISHLPDTNFWHYSLQLNTYKAIIEKHYGKRVTQLALVRLHPDTIEETYELLPVPILTDEINALFELRRNEVKPVLPVIRNNNNNIAEEKKTVLSNTKSIHEFFKKVESKKQNREK